VDWFTRYAETFLASRIADSDTQRDINRVRELISDGKERGISLSELTRKTQSMRRRDREDCVKTLVESGQIEAVQESTSGRPSTRFRSVANSSSS
jgi:hypothetical protein